MGTGALCCSGSTFPTIAWTSLARSGSVTRTLSEQEACPPSRLIREHARLVQEEGTGSASGADPRPKENPVLQAAWGTGERSGASKECRLLGCPEVVAPCLGWETGLRIHDVHIYMACRPALGTASGRAVIARLGPPRAGLARRAPVQGTPKNLPPRRKQQGVGDRTGTGEKSIRDLTAGSAGSRRQLWSIKRTARPGLSYPQASQPAPGTSRRHGARRAGGEAAGYRTSL